MFGNKLLARWSPDRLILATSGAALAATAGLVAFSIQAGLAPALAALAGIALGTLLLIACVQPLARHLERRSRRVADNAAALIGYIDVEQRYRYNNATYEEWLNAQRSDITGREVKEVLGEAVYEALRPRIEQALNGRRTTFETRLSAGGRSRDVQGTYVPDIDEAGRVKGLFEVLTDITRLKEVERELAALAHYDPLTGAANKIAFDDHLWQALARARRGTTATSVMALEIDRFKEVKRKLGNAAGDALLREFAVRLKASVRATDTVGRFGADEFAVVLETVGGRDEITRVARKILEAIRAPVRLGNVQLQITTSIGAALGPHDIAPDQLIKDAGTALSWAQTAGGNTFRVNEPGALQNAAGRPAAAA